MAAGQINRSGAGLDLSPRVTTSTAVVASPALAAETIIARVTIPADVPVAVGVLVLATAAFTVGTSGVSVQVKVRRTNVSGTTVYDSGVMTAGVAAAALDQQSVVAFDTGATPGTVYVLTLTVGSGSAPSTVSAVELVAVAV